MFIMKVLSKYNYYLVKEFLLTVCKNAKNAIFAQKCQQRGNYLYTFVQGCQTPTYIVTPTNLTLRDPQMTPLTPKMSQRA